MGIPADSVQGYQPSEMPFSLGLAGGINIILSDNQVMGLGELGVIRLYSPRWANLLAIEIQGTLFAEDRWRNGEIYVAHRTVIDTKRAFGVFAFFQVDLHLVLGPLSSFQEALAGDGLRVYMVPFASLG